MPISSDYTTPTSVIPAVADNQQDGLVREFPLILTGPTTYNDSNFLTTVNTLYSTTLARRLIKLVSVKVLTYNGDPKVRKNTLYDSSYDKSIADLGIIFSVPQGGTEMECPLFTLLSGDSLTLEFGIRMITETGP